MIVTVEVLWRMNMRILVSNFHDMILLAGSSIDDRDCRSVMANQYQIACQLLSWPMNMRLFTSYGRRHDLKSYGQ